MTTTPETPASKPKPPAKASDPNATPATQASEAPPEETTPGAAAESADVVDNGIAPATEFDPSGAPIQSVPDVDPSHPAVDNDPRANTTAEQNRIDWNDPSKSGQQVVEERMAAQAGADDE